MRSNAQVRAEEGLTVRGCPLSVADSVPDVTHRHMAVNIRKFVLQAHSLDQLVALDTLSAQAALFREAAVASGLNVPVSGGPQAGSLRAGDRLPCSAARS